MMKLSRKKTKSLNEFLKLLIQNKLSETGQTLKTVKFIEISFEENNKTGQLILSKVIARVKSEFISGTEPVSESYNLTIYGPATFDYSENEEYMSSDTQNLNFTKKRSRGVHVSAFTE